MSWIRLRRTGDAWAKPRLNYTRLSPFSSGPLTEAGPFLRSDGGTLDGIHICSGFACDAPPRTNCSLCKRPSVRYEHPGMAVARKKFLPRMADPFGFWHTTTTADPQPWMGIASHAGARATRAEQCFPTTCVQLRYNCAEATAAPKDTRCSTAGVDRLLLVYSIH